MKRKHGEGKKTPLRPPDVIIAGVRRCGAAALGDMLHEHPAVAMAEGEVRYFDLNLDRGPKWYMEQLPRATTGQLLGERTAGYFVASGAPEEIKKVVAAENGTVVVFDAGRASPFCSCL